MDKTIPSILNRRHATARRRRSSAHQPTIQGVHSNKSTTVQAQHHQIMQRCIDEEGGKALLLEIHEGTCGHHVSSRVLMSKAFKAGIYWPTAMKNVEDIVRRCVACQKFASKPPAPASELKTIPLSWPFATWGLDMVGPLKKS